MNFGKKAVALAVRQIKAGAEINDSYGSVYHHMDKAERQQFLQVSQEPSKAKNYAYLIMCMQIVHDLIDIHIRCGHVVRDFESEAKTRCNFQFR